MSEIFWGVYGLFHDPPNTPKDIKCIGCKVAGGCTCLAASGLILAGCVKNLRRNVYLGSFLGLMSLFSFSGAMLAFKLANDDNIFNQRLIATHKEFLSKTRVENRVNNQNIS